MSGTFAGPPAREQAASATVGAQQQGPERTVATSRGTVAYFIGEDWFFCSHFVPMARAARDHGFDIVVLTRPGERSAEIESHGFRVVTLDFSRNDLNPLRKLATVRRVAAILARERPVVLHNVALSYAILGTLAGRMARVPAIVNAITGLGYLLVAPSPLVRLLRAGLWRTLPPLFNNRRVAFLFENPDDAAMAVRHRWTVPARVTIVPGAGVDTDHFSALPAPTDTPLRVALVGRMLWQKGPDLAVEAKRELDRRGVPCELWLVGRSDPDNPRAIPEETLRRWAAEPGIRWAGFCPDVREIWRACHVAVAPSRGGEGLPRSLIEAAACGRPLVASDVPGSREIVRPGVNGLLVPPGDALALADAVQRLAGDPELRHAYGAASRSIAAAEYRDDIVGETIADLYRRIAGPG